MGERETEVQLHIIGQETLEVTQAEHKNLTHQPTISPHKKYKSWILITIYTLFTLAGQTAGTILGRLYFDKGGNSKWMATFVQIAGFPSIIFFYFLIPKPTNDTIINNTNSPSKPKLLLIYISFGIFLGANSLLYSIGLSYLPVSTYTLICASQLGFNALFSFFLNSQKFTPFIINSIVLLTISSALLMFEHDSNESNQVSKGKYVIGFMCTIGASAGYGLTLASIQFCFKKVLKQENFKMILDMIIYPSLVGTLAVLVGLFGSGEWKKLTGEMEGFELGKVSYIMTLIWIAICWQVFNIGCMGLILEVSSLFSNVIGTLGLPIVPVLAVFIFHDTMDGLKIIAMILALWGFVSYVYQQYLDDYKSKNVKEDVSQDFSIETKLLD